MPIPPVVNAEQLLDYPDAVVADVRWYLDGRSGREEYERGHLPGAVFVDIDADLAAHDQPPTSGRHPLPNPDVFAATMTRLGIGDDTTVIAYDDTGGMTAGRLVVMLRMLGRDAALLDGGIAAWSGELMTGHGAGRDPRPFTARPWPTDRLASVDDVVLAGATRGAVLTDARAPQRFTGEVTAVDPLPGHIPGAVNAPWSAVVDATTKRFRSIPELRDHYAALGITPATSDVVSSCGSGVSACINILAMEHAGLAPGRLYVASFSGWAADPERVVAVGDA